MPRNDCQNLTDEQTWNLFLQGDTPAFEKLMKTHYQALFNYGGRFLRDHNQVKDHIQDLFLGLWKNRSGLQSTLSVKHYLLKSLRRRILRSIPRYRLISIVDDSYFDAGFNMVLPVEADIIVQEKLTELSYKVRAVLEKLSRRQQEIIYLRFYMEADINEIAGIMELEHQSVYNLLHESLKRFKSFSNADYFSTSFCIAFFPVLAVLEEILKNIQKTQ